MQFCTASESILNPFISSFTQLKRDHKSINRNDTKQYKLILGSLYDDLKQVSKEDHEATLTEQHYSLPPSVFTPGVYFPENIRKYILNQPIVQHVAVAVSPDCHMYLSFFQLPTPVEYDEHISKLRQSVLWLRLCKKYAASAVCAQTLNIHIFLTPFKKQLPSAALRCLTPEHVNSAFTMDCAPQGEIVVFRAEEWFKVLLHETFHAFGMDIGPSPVLKDTLQNMFPIRSEFFATEAYCETFARIFNAAFCSFQSSLNKKTFILYMEFCLQLERMFALYQAHKVLRHMGLSYADICIQDKQKNGKYKEETHVFAYYILTAIFLSDYPVFLLWCFNHNTNLVQFPRSNRATHLALSAYVEEHYKNVHERTNVMPIPSKELVTTLRMSVL
jgi:hypothetical protein